MAGFFLTSDQGGVEYLLPLVRRVLDFFQPLVGRAGHFSAYLMNSFGQVSNRGENFGKNLAFRIFRK